MSAGRAAIGTMTVLACTGLACSSRTLPGTKPAEQEDVFALTADWAAFKQGPTTAVDILFMVDNSASMLPIQQQLARGFEAFGQVLDALPGGAPDLHLGIVSSDMGAGDGTITACSGSGNDGVLQDTPRGACTNSTLKDGARFIAVRTDPATGQRITNFEASTITEVFTCIANIGDTGCGFEQPFASVLRALGADGSPPPADNQGFLRPEAFLAVVMVGNEDDCSARSGAVSKLFDTEQRLLATEMGPVGSFRCNEFGHLCRRGGGAAAQAPSRREAASYEFCESNEDGLLISVADFVRSLRTLKGDPAKVFVAAVAGPSSPYAVRLADPSVPDQGGWPVIEHSCNDQGTDPPIYADPAVRIHQATSALGRYGTFQSICGNGTQIPLEQIAQRMTRPMGHPCVAPPVRAAACQVVDRWIRPDGTKAATILDTCETTGDVAPCWRLVEDPSACGADRRLEVERDGTEVPPGLMTAIDCSGQWL